MTATNTSEQKETEYFVGYLKDCPDCHEPWMVKQRAKVKTDWLEKSCFKPFCKEDALCDEQKPTCHWMKSEEERKNDSWNDSQVYDFDPVTGRVGPVNEAEPLDDCKLNPYKCTTDPCPNREPVYCVSIEKLTPRGLEWFKKLTREYKGLPDGIKEFADIKNSDRYFVRAREELKGHPDEMKYFKAFERHKEDVKERGGNSILLKCVEDAKRASEWSKGSETPNTDSSPNRLTTQDVDQQQEVSDTEPKSRDEWRVKHGRTSDEAARDWNVLPEDERKKIDPKNYKMVKDGSAFRKDRSRKVKKTQKK